MAKFLAWRLTPYSLIQLSWPAMILFQPYVVVHECLTVTSLQFVNGTWCQLLVWILVHQMLHALLAVSWPILPDADLGYEILNLRQIVVQHSEHCCCQQTHHAGRNKIWTLSLGIITLYKNVASICACELHKNSDSYLQLWEVAKHFSKSFMFQIVSSLQVFRPKFSMYFLCLQYMIHTLLILSLLMMCQSLQSSSVQCREINRWVQ